MKRTVLSQIFFFNAPCGIRHLQTDCYVSLLSTTHPAEPRSLSTGVMAGRFQSDGGVFVQTFAALCLVFPRGACWPTVTLAMLSRYL